MSDLTSTSRVLGSKIEYIEKELDELRGMMRKLEAEMAADRKFYQEMNTKLLVELKVLQTRMNFMAAGIGMVSGLASSLLILGLKIAFGG